MENGFISSVVVCVLCALTAQCTEGLPTDAKKKNILFLMADEMDGRILDPESPQIKPPLPNLHRLASSGAVFTTCYSQSPQCVPSRSAMMVGLRTDQIKVYDNFLGISSTNGNASDPDPHCVASFGHDDCVGFGKQQKAPPTFIDRLSEAGWNVSLYGKMHVGGGLDRFPGTIGEFPFSSSDRDSKQLREWTRGLGPDLNVKGKDNQIPNLNVPDNVEKPALAVDYAAIDSCVKTLRAGSFGPGRDSEPPQFLYCSIIAPHPPYKSNATYMAAVENLTVNVPEQVPLSKLHPNDVSTALLKGSLYTDNVSSSEVEHFRRVYFSMCYESDTLLGEVLNALESSGGVPNTYVMMVSDHGEDNNEHRQTGKNNMYDSGSRVACILAGPGINAGQKLKTFASLNDVFPTILSFAGLTPPHGLAGSSLLPLVDGSGDPTRRDYIIAQYHSVFSVTGEFMVRQGNLKLIVYGPNKFGAQYPPQLFNLENDPWELHDIAHNSSDDIARMLKILAQEGVDVESIDAAAKSMQVNLFTKYVYDKRNGAAGCSELMSSIYGDSFNASDAEKVAAWLGQPCPYAGPPPPDPTCTTGILDKSDGKPYPCCKASCGVCAHPSSACSVRSGGKEGCCPSIIVKSNKSCSTVGPPCIVN